MEKINFKEENSEGLCLLTKISNEKVAKNGKPYLVLTFSNGEEKLDVTIFCKRDEFQIDEKTVCHASLRKNGDYVDLMALEARPNDADPLDFVLSSPENPEVYYTKILKTLTALRGDQTGTLYDLSIGMMEEYKTRLLYYPASEKYSHVYVGGQIYYMFTTLQDVVNLSRGSHEFNLETVANAVILAPISNLFTMDADEYGEGEKNLFAWMQNGSELSVKMIEKYLEVHDIGIGKPKLTPLFIAIRASHGKRSYGSSIEPITREAYIVSTLLSINAKLGIYDETLKTLNKGEMSGIDKFGYPIVNI